MYIHFCFCLLGEFPPIPFIIIRPGGKNEKKKSVLFLNYSLHSGGIEKSLVTLLSLFNYEKYDVDLQLFANHGLFLPRVPKQVNLLPPLFPEEYKKNIRQAFPALMKSGHPGKAVCRLPFVLRSGSVPLVYLFYQQYTKMLMRDGKRK